MTVRRAHRNLTPLHPTLLLAVSVAFCGFSAQSPGAVAYGLEHGAVEASSANREGRGVVAHLLSVLQDAAKELRKSHGKGQAVPVANAGQAARLNDAQPAGATTDPPRVMPHVFSTPALIDLPPPTAAT